MKFHCTEKCCDGKGMWAVGPACIVAGEEVRRGALPCPSTFGGGLHGCLKRRPTPYSCEEAALVGEEHAATRPSGLRAIADGMLKKVDDTVIDCIADDASVPEWVRVWVISEVLPAMVSGAESLRVAAAVMEKSNEPG